VVAGSERRLVCYKLTRGDFDALLGSRDDVWRYEALTNVSSGRGSSEMLRPTMACQCCKQSLRIAAASEPCSSFRPDQVVLEQRETERVCWNGCACECLP
jgi:hypothetical protein